MPKPRVGQHIKEALHGKKASSNKSANIDFLKVQFKRLKVQIRSLIEALKSQHLSLIRINETRLLVARRVAALAADSPIALTTGSAPSEEDAEMTKTDDLTSYVAVHQNLHHRQKMYCDRFQEHVVEYAVEWEKVIVSRVTKSLARADKLRIELEHYQSKVDAMRNEKTRRIEKGGMIDTKLADKLFRNESKLGQSRKVYEAFASDLSKLIEEVTTRSWKDLHPIILKMSQFDATLASDEHQLLAHLNKVSDGLKKIAHRYHLTPESRMKELETLTETVFSCGSSLEHICSSDVKELGTEPSGSHKLQRSSSSKTQKMRGSGSSKDNHDEVVHGVINSLKMSSSSNTSTPKSSNNLTPSSLSVLDGVKKKSLLDSPGSSSRIKGRGSGEASPQNPTPTPTPVRTSSRGRASSRNRGEKIALDETSNKDPFHGLDSRNRGSRLSSTPSGRDKLRHEHNRQHVPPSPRIHGRYPTPSRRRQYHEEGRQELQGYSPRGDMTYSSRGKLQASSPRGDIRQYEEILQFENQENHQQGQFAGNSPRGGKYDVDRYSSALSPRCIPQQHPGCMPQQHYHERAEQQNAKPWYQFY